MKSGGVKFARDIDEAKSVGISLLKENIRGSGAKKVLIEEGISFEGEFFVGITYDAAAKEPVLLVSNK